MAAKKYLLCPGWVPSKTDGDRHYITAGALARLYGVPLSECLTMPEGDKARGWNKNHGLIELGPQYHGRYEVPTASHKGENTTSAQTLPSI